jgi:hypothetical protein
MDLGDRDALIAVVTGADEIEMPNTHAISRTPAIFADVGHISPVAGDAVAEESAP